MLLIFDLDDTLIETTAKITPIRLRSALKRMVESGLKVANYNSALAMIERLDVTARNSTSSLSEFVELYEGDMELFEMAKKEVYRAPLQGNFDSNEKVNHLLEELSEEHLLAIVTRGETEIQHQKIQRFGIDEELFCDIIVTNEKNKGIHYSKLAETYGFPFSEVVVIGDRVGVDLVDAISLGCITIHIRQGRGANYQGPIENIDYAIYDLSELREIMAGLTAEIL